MTTSTGEISTDEQFTNIQTPSSLPASTFVFTPPDGATQKEQYPASSGGDSASEPQILKNGTKAPDFTVNDPAGKPVKLSDYLGHVVVIDFWATWCGPCQESLPGTNKLAKSFAGQNVTFLGINVLDDKDTFEAWLSAHKQLSSIKFLFDPSGQDSKSSTPYGVSGIPTQFVIDVNGIITWSNAGYTGEDDGLKHAVIAALKIPVAPVSAPVSATSATPVAPPVTPATSPTPVAPAAKP